MNRASLNIFSDMCVLSCLLALRSHDAVPGGQSTHEVVAIRGYPAFQRPLHLAGLLRHYNIKHANEYVF